MEFVYSFWYTSKQASTTEIRRILCMTSSISCVFYLTRDLFSNCKKLCQDFLLVTQFQFLYYVPIGQVAGLYAAKVIRLCGIFFLCSHIQTIVSWRSPKYNTILKKIIPSSLTCCQISIICLVDDGQCGYITKFMVLSRRESSSLSRCTVCLHSCTDLFSFYWNKCNGIVTAFSNNFTSWPMSTGTVEPTTLDGWCVYRTLISVGFLLPKLNSPQLSIPRIPNLGFIQLDDLKMGKHGSWVRGQTSLKLGSWCSSLSQNQLQPGCCCTSSSWIDVSSDHSSSLWSCTIYLHWSRVHAYVKTSIIS